MKILLISISFLTLQFIAYTEEYQYCGKPISEEKFAEFYHYFKNYLYVDEDGKIYDIRRDLTCYNDPAIFSKTIVPLIEIWSTPEIGDFGVIDGKIAQVINSRKIILDASSWCSVNVSTKKMYDGQRFTAVGIVKRTYSYVSVMGARKTLPDIDLLDNLTLSAFNGYIRSNPLFYYKKTFEAIPAQRQICSSCDGKKKIKNPDYNRKSIESKTYIECPVCRGTGKEILQKERQREIFEKRIVDLRTKLPTPITE